MSRSWATAPDGSTSERGKRMTIRATLLASLLTLPLLIGASLAAGNSNRSLADAAKSGDRAAVQSLLDAGTNPNLAQADGTTPLFWAASRGDAQMVDVLLRARADVNAANDFGATPLYVAAENADAAI